MKKYSLVILFYLVIVLAVLGLNWRLGQLNKAKEKPQVNVEIQVKTNKFN